MGLDYDGLNWKHTLFWNTKFYTLERILGDGIHIQIAFRSMEKVMAHIK